MKQIIEFTKNWKHRNLLHIIGGLILCLILNLIVPWYISILVVFTIANYWEYSQFKFYKTKYSISDVLLTTLGSVLAILLI